MAGIRVLRSKTYKKWFSGLKEKEKRIIDTRIGIFRTFGLLVNCKTVGFDWSLYEFKWQNGFRVYFSFLKDTEGRFMLLLIGGKRRHKTKILLRQKT
jgi:putative component of toxin-antitoxin plasmid stabilization module